MQYQLILMTFYFYSFYCSYHRCHIDYSYHPRIYWKYYQRLDDFICWESRILISFTCLKPIKRAPIDAICCGLNGLLKYLTHSLTIHRYPTICGQAQDPL